MELDILERIVDGREEPSDIPFELDILERILDGREKPAVLSFELLQKITGNFSEDKVVGQGRLVTVYLGILPEGKVVVKRIRHNHSIDEELFRLKLQDLYTFSHQNVERFLGFCSSTIHNEIKTEGSGQYIYAELRERLLCFEYICNGSLQEHITDELRGLEWNTRFQIINGICEGLRHLHNETYRCHMDLKPANILLDSGMVPKITDIGLLRLDEKEQTGIAGTPGSEAYCAPEYLDYGKVSPKSDMFSLGIIITELVTGEKGIPYDNNNVLRRWRHRWRKSGKETRLAYQQVKKCMEIALLCREIDPHKRPCIQDVIGEINSVNGTINDDCEYASGQINPYSGEEMLGIEPLELHFPFELNKHILCSFELTNEMGTYIAFTIRNTSPLRFFIEPNKGIVPPKSKCIVEIILRAQEKAPQYMQQDYAFILQSTKVEDGFEAEDITAAMFKQKLHNVVDEVTLDVVLDAQLPSKLLDVHNLKLPFPSEPDNLNSMVLTLDVLKAITNDFSTMSELGRGAYGVVYKGVYPTGEMIAVKKLKSHLVEEEIFQNEVSYLMGIKHRHVVEFVGYCAESSFELMPQPVGRPVWFEVPKRLICLEYVCNKSLDNYISDESIGLDWNMRFEIIKGICNGLHFLHEECRIVHLDLKPENIMMDAAFMPKITDFGLSKIFGNKETRIITDNRLGTRGYMAPEYMFQGLITTKADIFSLGVLVIQIVTGHMEYPLSSSYFQLFNGNDSPTSTDISYEDFTEEVVGRWRTKFFDMPMYKSMEKYTQQVKHCITLALKCVEPDREKRPTLTDIIGGLAAAEQTIVYDGLTNLIL